MTLQAEGPARAAEVVPDRSQRPGGRWSVPGLMEEILRLAALERGVAHVLAGWAAKVCDLGTKVSLASDLEKVMSRAMALRACALTLLERDEEGLYCRSAWLTPLRQLDSCANEQDLVEGLALTRRSLSSRYRELAPRLDPLFDAKLLEIVEPAAALGGLVNGEADVLAAAWADGGSVTSPLPAAAWAPLGRAPVPGRPLDRPKPAQGSWGHLRTGSRQDDANIAGELNQNVIAELCALELLTRASYEHPDQPWSWHMNLARHVGDEARHAAIFRRLIAQRGYDEAALTVHSTNYELAYEFPECEKGSKRELLWRLLMLCTVLEGLAIDKVPPEIASLDWLGQHDIARAIDYISTDELYHAENGLRLTRQLCEELHLDPLIERERVHGRFFGRQLELREQYLATDPERAAKEIEIMESDPDGVPFRSQTEVELRKRATFSDADLEQVRRWGYNPLDT